MGKNTTQASGHRQDKQDICNELRRYQLSSAPVFGSSAGINRIVSPVTLII
jgi:hypothetical protein